MLQNDMGSGFAEAVPHKPGAMRAGDGAGKTRDRGYHRRPSLGRRMLVWAVVAAGMEAEISGSV